MTGITEADVAAALDAPEVHPHESSLTTPEAIASANPPSAGEAVPAPPDLLAHRVVDPRAQAVADRLLGHAPPEPDRRGSDPRRSRPARLVAAEGGAFAECAPGRALVIGRADGDLVVPLGVVSRRHCQVSHPGDRYVVTDLGSANGTLVCRPDGSTIQVTDDPVELLPGDVIATARGRRPIARLEPAGSPP
jgi:hypothetical protein